MELIASRARAQQLEAALAGSPGGAHSAPVARELAVATALRSAGAVLAPSPSEEFRAALRTRLLAVAAVQGIGETATAPVPAAVSWRSRAATVAAGVTAAAVAVTGVSAAASQSLPGDPFYGLKRTAEGVQLSLADGAQEEGVRHLQFADTRMRELRQLVLGRDLSGDAEAPDAARVTALLEDMDDETRSATRLLTEAFRSTAEADPVERLARFAESQDAGLREVLPELPQEARPRLRESLALVADVRTTADELLLLRDCTAECDPEAAAPTVPVGPGTDVAEAPCVCPTPVPEPSVAPVPGTAPTPTASGDPTGAPPSARPSSPAPAPSPSPSRSPSPSPSSGPGLPLPTLTDPGLPLPTLSPLPGLPTDGSVEVPSLPDGDGIVDGLLDGTGGALSGLAGVSLALGPAGAPALLAAVLHSWFD